MPRAKKSPNIELGGGLVRLPAIPSGRFSRPFRSPIVMHSTYQLHNAQLAYRVVPGFVIDAIKLLQLVRIGRIFQLQFLTPYRLSSWSNKCLIPATHGFGHDRLIHSITSSVMQASIYQNLQVDRTTLLIGILAELVHDALTSAGGDAMKMIDPVFFDEDSMIGRLFVAEAEGWKELRQRYSLPVTTPDIIQGIINGQGWQGEIHEVTDSCSYVALDSQELALVYSSPEAEDNCNEDHRTIMRLAANGSCTLWQKVLVSSGHAVIANASLLHKFLELRAWLWAKVYNHPESKIMELLHTEIIFPYLFRSGIIRREKLLRMDDRVFRRLIDKTMEIPQITSKINFLGEWPVVYFFSTWREALPAEAEAVGGGGFTILADARHFQETKSKTNRYWLETEDGRQTFEEACPEMAEDIMQIVRSTTHQKPVHLFVYRGGQALLSSPLRRAWQEARERWISKRE